MEIVCVEDPGRVADEAVRRIEVLVRAATRAGPGPCIGFPTGKTPLLVFERLARRRAQGLPADRIRPVGLDEYVGVAPTHPGSFAAYIGRHVTGPLGISPKTALLLDGSALDL